MKKFIITLLLLYLILPAYASTMFMQGVGQGAVSNTPSPVTFIGSTSGTSSTPSFITNVSVSAGNTIVILVSVRSTSGTPSVSSVTDSSSNTYTRLVRSNATLRDAEIWYCLNPVSLPSGSTISMSISGTIVTGGVSAAALNKTASVVTSAATSTNGSGGTASLTTGASVPTGGFTFAALATGGNTITGDPTFISLLNAAGASEEYFVSIANGTVTNTQTPGGGNWRLVIGAFQ